MKRIIWIVAGCIFLFSVNAHAFTSRGSVIMTDTLYGGIVGAVIGGATLAFANEPKDHFDHIGYGAATGVIVGALFGVFEAVALVNYDNGNIKIAFPTLHQAIGKDVRTSIDLFKINF
ncbi:MAG: hypothetical protein HQK76_03110 [Desulfobacterales bacterium]|nr:hypothetical protein [Desulfobacterales bacterium]